jgi:hypothetical protein
VKEHWYCEVEPAKEAKNLRIGACGRNLKCHASVTCDPTRITARVAQIQTASCLSLCEYFEPVRPPFIMPGPSNMKKKRKSQGKSQKKKPVKHNASSSTTHDSPRCLSACSSRSDSQQPVTPPPVHVITSTKAQATLSVLSVKAEEHVPHLTPFIYDPGTGPRVRDTRAFLTSRYFSQPPALEVKF